MSGFRLVDYRRRSGPPQDYPNLSGLIPPTTNDPLTPVWGGYTVGRVVATRRVRQIEADRRDVQIHYHFQRLATPIN